MQALLRREDRLTRRDMARAITLPIAGAGGKSDADAASRAAMTPASLLVRSLALTVCVSVSGQGFHERDPIRYGESTADNAVTALDRRLAAGELELTTSARYGRLPTLLQALGIPISSQTLVFSKTSFQRHHISPRNPRAIYFGPDVYVGYVPGAPILEIATTDPRLGIAFYTLSQDPNRPGRLLRDDSCLTCHAGSRTDNEPGLLLRSVFPAADGEPITPAGETRVTVRTPMAERWGGWLVTGTFDGEHRGNGTAQRSDRGYRIDSRPAADLTAFADDFDVDNYPAQTSDIAALLALEQQVTVHNRMTRAALQMRVLLAGDQKLNERLNESGLREQTAELADALAYRIARDLFLGAEPALDAHAIEASPAFAAAFPRLWPTDDAGVRLGEFDLKQHTFTLPLSPMVHSRAFAALPPPLRDRVIERLRRALIRNRAPASVKLTKDQRARMHAHLTDTLAGYDR